MNNEWTFWANGDSTLIIFIPPPDKDEIHLVISDNITELNADTYLSLVDHSAMLHTLIEQNEEKHYVIDECDGKLKKGTIREQIKSEKEWYSMRNINLFLKYCITINSKYCCTEKMSQVLISIRTLRIMKDGGSIDCGITPFNVSDADLLKKRFIAKAIKRKYIRVSAYLEKRIMIGSIHRLRWYNITLQEEGFHHINDVSGTSSISGDILEANILNNNKSDIIYIVVKNLNDGDIVEEECIETLDHNENDIIINNNKNNAFLITRKRRFGKNNNSDENYCSIIDCLKTKISFSDDILLGLTVKFLCKYLNEFYKIRSIILIDEYDKIFSESSLFKNNYFSDYYEFTEDVLKKVLSNFSISDSKEKSDSDNTKDGIKEKLKKKYIYSEKNKELKNLFKNNNLNFDIEFLKLLCGEMIEFLFDKLSQIKYNYLTNDISYEDRWKKSKDIMYFKIQNREVLEYLRQFVDELNLNILILYSSYMLFKYLKNDSKIIFQRGKLQL
ncbi:hypothetical protein H8356DRAFT_1338339 [Neocallimastix lanati (nom. inval.)]|nr:hypothetical protein H8356DRAFT_1338339 [Neocallimastix sp. JGI-2020a]